MLTLPVSVCPHPPALISQDSPCEQKVAEEMGGKNRAFFSLILESGCTFLGSAYYIRLSE